MKKLSLLLIGFIMAFASYAQQNSNTATPQEVVEKVHKAAQLLKEKGDFALPILRDNTSEFTWKDTYIFLIDVGNSIVLSNPAFREREGGNIREHKDWNQDPYGQWLCELALKGGGWMEFNWPKPGTQNGVRKVSYIYPIPGLKYTVCAGVYDETRSIEQLNALTDKLLNKTSEKSVAVIFEVTPTEAGKDEYLKIAGHLKSALAKYKGLISIERFESLGQEGKLLSLSIWENMECVDAWRNDMMHRQGQKKGHEQLFSKYNIRVAEIIRDYTIKDRAQAPNDSNQHLMAE